MFEAICWAWIKRLIEASDEIWEVDLNMSWELSQVLND
jgi:hypothetical protein